MPKRNIVVEREMQFPPFKRDVELVERKGIGHPDSLIDGVMEEISRELSREYLNEFGRILHHNVDKGQICGGATEVEFGGGLFTKPIYVLLSGRATAEAEGRKIPVQHIAIDTAKRYLKDTVRHLDVDSDVEIESRISAGSAELASLFSRSGKMPVANDTSFGTGFAPLDDLERLVLAVENYLNSADYKISHPSVGEDIKVMGLRQGNGIKLTVSIAFVSKYLEDIDAYAEHKEKVTESIIGIAEKITEKEVEVSVNTADDIEKKSVYITLSGTSAEMGDDGSVGRGNRVNGLITPFRGMSLEAAAGKNPVNHVGKIYSVLATVMSREIAEEHEEIEDITITLLSEIGKPIDQPKVASVSVLTKEKGQFDKLKDKVAHGVDRHLEEITEMTNQIVFGKVRVF
ncbi:methionine adenosyltransferase [Candidatus Micrarchaeota archaeon]|nr:methionine adenosyltransferase [Candidatus Micrarchaeota archaeon]